jgi:hydrogenase nickel incorporation protein HypB
MCTTCGCGGGEATVDDAAPPPAATAAHSHDHAHGEAHVHDHAHGEAHVHDHAHGSVARPFVADAPLLPIVLTPEREHAARLVRVERDLLSFNADIAAKNRAAFRQDRTLTLNLMSSPGAGKTTLLVATLRRLAGVPVGVIEGDQATSLDADRIREAGAPAVQVNTGAGCHLDAGMIARARTRLPSLVDGLLFIENVGNLVCPAAFDLGEARRVVIVSVTEGEDKPLKYPAMFASANLVVMTKSDLLPHLDVDLTALVRHLDRVAPGVPHLLLSARTGDGMDAWCAWIRAR